MAEPVVVPLFVCGREDTGHHCHLPRGHRGGHTCRCGQHFTYWRTTPIQHHDLTTMTFPESEQAA